MAPPEGPTQVPRADGVRDGEWNDLDARLVVESQDDANATFERFSPSSSDAASSGAFPLLGLTLPELKAFAADRGMPAFRGKQLRDHLYGAAPRATLTISPLFRRLRASHSARKASPSVDLGCTMSRQRPTAWRSSSSVWTTTRGGDGGHPRDGEWEEQTHRVRLLAGGLPDAMHVLRHG